MYRQERLTSALAVQQLWWSHHQWIQKTRNNNNSQLRGNRKADNNSDIQKRSYPVKRWSNLFKQF